MTERQNRDGTWSKDPGLGWQGSRIDFEITGKPGSTRVATAWDKDVCVAKFTTGSRFVLWVRLWIWHYRFNRRGRA